jgi:indole-3-glycerol phosphate synthase
VSAEAGGRPATVLDEILEHKRGELDRARAALAPERMAVAARDASGATLGFRARLESAPRPRVIAEIKRRSPSQGEIRPDFDPVACARAYQANGAAAISVLTDERYFGGSLEVLESVRSAVTLPLLRKDFILDAYQIDEARLRGADAVLLIAAAFPLNERARRIAELRIAAREVGLDALVEVHDEEELAAALAAGADLVGINNRDLRTFEVDLAVTERLAKRIPEGIVVVAESGIFTDADVARLEACGAAAVLVGEALMREEDLGLALRRLRRNE